MKTSKHRLWSRFAFAAGIGLAQLVACSSDNRPNKEEVQRTGTLGLALEATAESGTRYRLRSAFFEITDVRSGEFVDFLSSEDAPETARVLRRLLPTGNFTVTLQPGWFLERVSSGGTGGAGGTSGSGGSGGKGGTGSAGKGGGPGRGTGGTGGTGMEGGVGAAGPDEGSAGEFSTGGTGAGGTGAGGTGAGGTGGETTEIVEAFLLSDAVQFFSLFGGDEAFVNFLFQVGGDVIDFNRGVLNIGIEVIEDPSICESPPDAMKPGRMLLETNVDAMNSMTLGDVFAALASNGGLEADPDLLYRQIYDSYASAENATIADAVHCGDETTDGLPSLNGFPISCDRPERFHVDDQFGFFQTAFVNRMDLAPENGAHCGQMRAIFANNQLNRAFMIIEAQIPNPAPELGIQGCVPLAQFWLEQNQISDPFERGQRLANAYLFGDPGLAEAGFGPFYTATNVTVGSGQIRTNQFDTDPWTLREFKLALDGTNLKAIPFPTAESPNGALWNENVELPAGPACRQNFLDATDQLLTNNPSQMSFVINSECKDAESRNDFSEDYAGQLSDGFRQALEARLEGTGLSATDIANRAQFAGSCIGCHEESRGRFLGNGVFAPSSNSFTHVDEFGVPCQGDSGTCFRPSPALTDVFLPDRLNVLGQILGIEVIPDPCGGSGGSGGSGGIGGAPGVGGSFAVGGSFGSGGRGGIAGSDTGSAGESDPGAPMMEGPSEPAPVIEIELPQADEPVAAMQEEEEEIRESYGEKTLSGRSARSTH
jgi:hypothetical protein